MDTGLRERAGETGRGRREEVKKAPERRMRPTISLFKYEPDFEKIEASLLGETRRM